MQFKTTEKIDNWIKEHSANCKDDFYNYFIDANEQFKFIFTPNYIASESLLNLNIECEVKCKICKKSFTDYIK